MIPHCKHINDLLSSHCAQSSFWLDLSSMRTFREELVTGRKVNNVELTKDRLYVCAWAAQILIHELADWLLLLVCHQDPCFIARLCWC